MSNCFINIYNNIIIISGSSKIEIEEWECYENFETVIWSFVIIPRSVFFCVCVTISVLPANMYKIKSILYCRNISILSLFISFFPIVVLSWVRIIRDNRKPKMEIPFLVIFLAFLRHSITNMSVKDSLDNAYSMISNSSAAARTSGPGCLSQK